MSNLTLSQFLQQEKGNLTPELAQVIDTIAATCKTIDQALQKGALAGILGSAGNENVQGETQKKLDVISNDYLIDALKVHPHVGGLASEELDDFTPAQENGEYLVLFDPLDGSSNIDINMCVGTIFSILPAKNAITQAQDFMQAGTQQVAAGYVLYGPSTMMALTVGNGVAFFTLDPVTQTFLLTTENVQVSADTQEFAINASNQRHWEQPVKQYIEELLAGKTSVREKDFNMRWVACMVGDVHRILCRGGIFLYPYDLKDPKKAGRLRLMYEANPMSMLIEQAGGASTTGRVRILEIEPTELHQRVPVIIGSKNEVERVTSYH
ncbi:MULTISPECIES: class 1 fructose-bisphosphatase [Acinetobacter]|uniref:Fructose-1,6-bisphosphatase class 1 n=10 Tax=Acinetobacter baumannii TaxID=470 RepID=F16PA_ACIBY|nr:MULTISPECIES: class 1 fructose-bisphosphatase [Acinetobacter]B0VDK0.1 RecName: Full=Fructose-1,6-bisphosphatase class 1; Short=FBPase class 1; AltName: Full=D-fructose-1,6-bisphosphate 1-phosphohydrolase class 1 [Acinetobacter baumannii AYE]EMT94454.1 fructose-1,6-bisphosphatase [Acinetobacter baumannii ABNIH6]PXA50797.1 class 1 fructose-bisphosphatase [Acinetobacter baumannii A424]ACJ42344.1 fructose-bisphosphatase [Acinetobacter baumannii AB0057]AJF82714.1 Fructose-1,6-bisphosphatase [Aci